LQAIVTSIFFLVRHFGETIDVLVMDWASGGETGCAGKRRKDRMLDPGIVARCRAELIRTASAGKLALANGLPLDAVFGRGTITYGALAGILGVANQGVGLYLDDIYEGEIEGRGRSDLTTAAVYAKTGFGRFNSQGATVRSGVVDPSNAHDRQTYREELLRVYAEWG
jgi:hypothetical protein